MLSKNFVSYLSLASLFFLAASPMSCTASKKSQQNQAKTAEAPKTDWEELMLQVNNASDAIEKGIRRKSDKEEILKSVEEMRSAFAQLRKVKPPQGSADLFRQYCEAGGGILQDVQGQVEHAYWEKAEASFGRIKDLQRDIERDFAPGIWSRLKLWNAR